ncbi:peptidoglycan-binding domain-containing protein [Mesorhizobium sp. L-2-11]|uniref:peptidoglycan-binding domain-containing protein n=1 Tax=Mesorhizobium sp. L-2-11 TaxID=2744521 RepID=UPI00406D08B6
MRLPFSWTVVVALATALGVTDPATSQESQHSARQIQQALADHGYDLGTADGIWGRRSISALKAFQKANNLPQTGTLDEATSAALFPQVRRGPLTPIATHSLPSLLEKPGVPTKITPQTSHGEARQADGDVHQASAKSDRLEPEPNKVGEAPTIPTPRLIYLGLLAVATAFFFLRRRRSRARTRFQHGPEARAANLITVSTGRSEVAGTACVFRTIAWCQPALLIEGSQSNKRRSCRRTLRLQSRHTTPLSTISSVREEQSHGPNQGPILQPGIRQLPQKRVGKA